MLQQVLQSTNASLSCCCLEKKHVSLLVEVMQLDQFPNVLLNIYQTGSRVYGTAKEDADYDFFVIIDDDSYDKLDVMYGSGLSEHTAFAKQWYFSNMSLNSELFEDGDRLLDGFIEGYQCLYLDADFGGRMIELNVNLYKFSTFQKKLNENWLQALMCIYLPDKFLWRLDMPSLHADTKLYYRKLIISVVGEGGKHFQMARRKWGKLQEKNAGSTIENYQERKYIAHTFRDITFGIQLAKYLSIVDYSEANDRYFEIMSHSSQDNSWEHYEKVYYPQYQKLKDVFNEITKKDDITTREDAEKFGFHSVAYLAKMKGNVNKFLEDLRLFFSIESQQWNEGDFTLCYLKGNERESPNYSPIVREVFHGMVLCRNNKTEECKALCVPPQKIIPYSNKFSYKISNWKKSKVHELCAFDSLIHLYYNVANGKWMVCTEDVSVMEDDSKFWDTFNRLFGSELLSAHVGGEMSMTFIMSQPKIGLPSLNLLRFYNTSQTPIKWNPLSSQNEHNYLFSSCSLSFSNIAEVKAYTNTCDIFTVRETIVWDNEASSYVSIPSLQYEALQQLLEGRNTESAIINTYLLEVVRLTIFVNVKEALNQKFEGTKWEVQYQDTLKKYLRFVEWLEDEYSKLENASPDLKTFNNLLDEYECAKFFNEGEESAVKSFLNNLFNQQFKMAKTNMPRPDKDIPISVSHRLSMCQAKYIEKTFALFK